MSTFKLTVSFGTLLFVVSTLGLGGCRTAPAHAETKTAPAKTVATLDVEGMLSPSCPVLVRKALEKVAGVESVEASYEDATATVTFDERQVSLVKIRAIIKDRVGFETRIKNVDRREGPQSTASASRPRGDF